MNGSKGLGLALGLAVAVVMVPAPPARGETALGTAFTYQGRLKQDGVPLTGTPDLQFSLWDAATGGAQVDTTQTLLSHLVANGLFTAPLDFGAGAFTGDARWLQIVVEGNTLTPRQKLTATPYALCALNALQADAAPWTGLSGVPADLLDGDQDTTYTAGDGLTLAGTQFAVAFAGNGSALTVARSDHTHDVQWASLLGVPADFADGIDDDTTYTAGAGLSLTGTQFALAASYLDGSAYDARFVNEGQPDAVSTDMLQDDAVTAAKVGPDILSSLSGVSNDGGNIDLVAGAGITIVPDDGADTITIAATGAIGPYWSLIGNSGTDPDDHFIGTTDAQPLLVRVNNALALRIEPNATCPNLIGGHESNSVGAAVVGATIGGGGGGPGAMNYVGGDFGTVGGGETNSASSPGSTVSGGERNGVFGACGTVAGGYENDSSGIGSTVSGGHWNGVFGTWATIGGGKNNVAGGNYATVGGGEGNTGTGPHATVPGGHSNTAGGAYSFAAGRRARANHQGAFVWADAIDADYASTAEHQFSVRATGGVRLHVGTAGGGLRIHPDPVCPNLIGGHEANAVTAGAHGATLMGGGDETNPNRVTDDYGTVGGGVLNQAGDDAGTTSDAAYATVGGGFWNIANGEEATIGGGRLNRASADCATIGGGYNNDALGSCTTVGGGFENVASAHEATVGGGYWNNATASNATIGGGYSNHADGESATVGGGWSNQATGDNATIGGGYVNQANGESASVGGGSENRALADYATIAGGGPSDPGDPTSTRNRVHDAYGTIGGGGNNRAGSDDGDPDSTRYATVGGGEGNTASGSHATVAGGGGSDVVWPPGNTASGHFSTVGGGSANVASGVNATVAGGMSNAASNSTATVGGGAWNQASGVAAVVGGGGGDIFNQVGNTASGDYAVVPGGASNTAAGDYSFAAGRRAKANYLGSFVWADATDADFASTADNQFLARATGGVRLELATGALRLLPAPDSPNLIGGWLDNSIGEGVKGAVIAGGGNEIHPNRVTDDFGAVGGGDGNVAGSDDGDPHSDWYATVGGGASNHATGNCATVGGGGNNDATGYRSTVCGGFFNRATATYATVGGGGAGTFLEGNRASGPWSTVCGGTVNEAAGEAATVPGGLANTAGGDYSFAAGRRAKANHPGSFVWADSTDADFASARDDHFHVKATGGVGLNVNGGWMEIYIDTPSNRFLHTSTGAWLTTGGVWTNGSDAASKENFTPVDGRDVLRRVAALPITAWNFKAEDPAVRHIGPMAQDFRAAFGLGSDDKTIGTLDADGVALAAIQGLHGLVREREAQLADMAARLEQKEGEIVELRERLARIEALIASLAQDQKGGE